MKRTFIALAATLAVLPVAVVAHHSFAAEYDGSKPMNLVGVISKVDQQNPHGFFYMSVPSTTPNGRATTWALETPGPNQLVRTGFTQMYQGDDRQQGKGHGQGLSRQGRREARVCRNRHSR